MKKLWMMSCLLSVSAFSAQNKELYITIGADAVIGVDLDYSEFSGGGKSMLFIVASGTAVKLKKG